MKFPKRKKRGPFSAHSIATTPAVLLPAAAAVALRRELENVTSPEGLTRPKLRRKPKSRNLRADHVFDAELTGKNSNVCLVYSADEL